MSNSASLWQDVLLERDLSEGFSGGLSAMFADPVEKSNPGKMYVSTNAKVLTLIATLRFILN